MLLMAAARVALTRPGKLEFVILIFAMLVMLALVMFR